MILTIDTDDILPIFQECSVFHNVLVTEQYSADILTRTVEWVYYDFLKKNLVMKNTVQFILCKYSLTTDKVNGLVRNM